MIAAHYIGDTVTTDNVPAIVRETAAQGWPHVFTIPELQGLGRATARLVFPNSPNRGGGCSQSPTRLTCTLWKPSGYTIVVAYRGCRAVRAHYPDRGPCGVYEDGSARGYVVAILLPAATYTPSGKDTQA